MTFEGLSPGDVGEVELVGAMFADQAELARLDDGVDLVWRLLRLLRVSVDLVWIDHRRELVERVRSPCACREPRHRL